MATKAQSPFRFLSPNKYLYLKFLRGCNFIDSLDMKAQARMSNEKQNKWTPTTHFVMCTLLIQPKNRIWTLAICAMHMQVTNQHESTLKQHRSRTNV
jgi:hypothetical protein